MWFNIFNPSTWLNIFDQPKELPKDAQVDEEDLDDPIEDELEEYELEEVSE